MQTCTEHPGILIGWEGEGACPLCEYRNKLEAIHEDCRALRDDFATAQKTITNQSNRIKELCEELKRANDEIEVWRRKWREVDVILRNVLKALEGGTNE